MARILVCDHCRTPDGVHAGQLELCAKCAIDVLMRLLQSDIPGMRENVLAFAQPAAPASPPIQPLTTQQPLSDEDKAARRRTALFVQHQTEIFAVDPENLPDKLPQTIKYGPKGEEREVEVLEAVPGKPGMFFAKIMV